MDLDEERKPLTLARKPLARWTRSGLYSWVCNRRLPEGRAFTKTRRELAILRDNLVDWHGGDNITPDAMILVDSIIEALGVQKLLGLYIRKYGVIDERSAKAGRLELNPILAKNWISYGNMVRQALLALREITSNRETEEILNPFQVAALIDSENARKEATVRDKKEEKDEIVRPDVSEGIVETTPDR